MKLIKPSHKILTNIDNNNKILRNIEAAGRTCYKSEDKITRDSAERFVKQIIKSGHHSVIEHESISVRFICDRGISHELVRHRLASYSQESSRYISYKDGVVFIIPCWLPAIKEGYYNLNQDLSYKDDICIWINSMLLIEKTYKTLVLVQGWQPQQARSVLTNSLKTEIVVTCNVREWIHIFNLRCAKAAHPQMREIMIPLREELRKKIPVIFD